MLLCKSVLKLFMILPFLFEISLSSFDSCSKILEEIKCSKDGKSAFLRNINDKKLDDVIVFTVATEPTEGYARYMRSAKFYGIEVQTLGMGTKWLGGDMDHPGGGYKINLLREAVTPFKDDKEKIILFTDSYDVIFLTPLSEIVNKFKKMNARVLFSSEHFCWPDASLRDKYPLVSGTGTRFLNSGSFIGYADDVYEILKTPIKDKDDDQLFYTKVYLDEEFREKHQIKLDHKSQIFQNLHGAEKDISLLFDDENSEGYLLNTVFQARPSVVHGNGLSKVVLNSLGNYLAGAFINNVCKNCDDNLLEFENDEKLPIVSLAIFIEKAMPFFEEFLDRILSINYPKDKINLFFHSNVLHHEKLVDKFITSFGNEYKNTKQIKVTDSINEGAARDLAVNQAIGKDSDYLFVVDAEAHIDNPDVLRELIRRNKDVIAPLMSRPKEVWSNFWGALSEQGYYARSHNYMDIVNNNIRGIWNVPYISSCYLIKKSVLPKISYVQESFDPDMAMCHHLRSKNIFLHVINLEHYGHLVNGDNFNTKLIRPDFYMLLSNQADWEQRYIHPEYLKYLEPNATLKQPCPDVFWFPVATDQFCDDMIAIMEAYGKWSDGTSNDDRIQGGYEAVPTRDIHMNQVGLEQLWLKFLQLYVRPLQEAAFLGYYHNPPRSLMNFVVRYRPDEQPFLRPHHDSSTYTINIALNRVGIDYEGGGCNFLRYNCSVKATKKGWMLMHPGRLTHFHEGLRVTKGTRYIMISFVDP